MSGGHFDHQEHSINDVADSIQLAVDQNDSAEKDRFGSDLGYHFPKEVVDRLQKAAIALKQAYEMAHEASYLLAGDTGPESFLKRWKEKDLDRMSDSAITFEGVVTEHENENDFDYVTIKTRFTQAGYLDLNASVTIHGNTTT